MLKRFISLVLAVGCLMGLSGCFLLPKEPEVPELPLVTPYSGAEYIMASVTRGDMVLSQTVSLSYSATRREDLKFSVADKKYGTVFVSVGDRVSAGELVAELESESLKDAIQSTENAIEKLEIQLAAAQEAFSIAQEQEALRGGSDAASKAREADIAYYSASLEIRRQKLAEQQNELESLRLYAGIDGTVTYVKTIKEGDTSSKADLIVAITDTDSSLFKGSTTEYRLFPAGAEMNVLSGSEEYPCKVVTAEALGIENPLNEHGQKNVFLQIIGPELPSGDNIRGQLELTLDSRSDVLMVPKRAVFTVGEQAYVYYEDANGLKNAKPVKTGLTAGQFTEILDGLSEGDSVIVG